MLTAFSATDLLPSLSSCGWGVTLLADDVVAHRVSAAEGVQRVDAIVAAPPRFRTRNFPGVGDAEDRASCRRLWSREGGAGSLSNSGEILSESNCATLDPSATEPMEY